MTTVTGSRPAHQSHWERWVDFAAQKPLCGYPVPACCHGNAVRGFNTSLCPLPASLLSSFFPSSSRLSPSLFVSRRADSLSRSVSQSCFLWRSCVFQPAPPSSPCLVLSAKWHFTSCFLLLTPCYFAWWDSVKAPVKKLRPFYRSKLQLLSAHTHNYLNICRQMYAWMVLQQTCTQTNT